MTERPRTTDVLDAITTLDEGGEGVGLYDLYEYFSDDYPTGAVADRVDDMLLSGEIWRSPATSRLRPTRDLVEAREDGESAPTGNVSATVERLSAESNEVPKAPRNLVEQATSEAAIEAAIAEGEVYEVGSWLKVPRGPVQFTGDLDDLENARCDA